MSIARASAIRSTAAAALLASCGLSYAQTGGLTFDGGLSAGPIVSPSASNSIGPSSPSQPQLDYSDSTKPSTLTASGLTQSSLPSFQWNANAYFSESYVSNGTAGSGQSDPDYESTLGFSSSVHEHTRRISLDANYNFLANFYAKNTTPTQINNYLQAAGKFAAIPDYLNINLNAFAQPIVTDGLGPVTAGNREIPGAYSNSYGYFASPTLTFRLGDFATSQTMPSFGQVFFETPSGTNAANTLPGLVGSQNTTMRSLTQSISSGPDFSRLNWTLTGLFSETAEPGLLLSEKTGVANVRYAIDHEWSLLATGGYDKIKDSVAFIQNVSGPVALAGFGFRSGDRFAFQVEAGQRYNKFSLTGGLLYDVGANSEVSAAVNDYVQTPEGQALNSLIGATAPLTTTQDYTTSTFGSSLNTLGNQSAYGGALNQVVSRYQTANLTWTQKIGRNTLSYSMFGTRRTNLTAGFVGPEVDNDWGSMLQLTRSMTPLLTGNLGATYTKSEEFGGSDDSISLQGGLNYSLARTTSVYLQGFYLDRFSSQSLQGLSPFAGSYSDFMITVGISHTL